VIKGVFNIRNIKEVDKPSFSILPYELKAITYDADILIDNVTEGGKNQTVNGQAFVPSSGILDIYSYHRPEGHSSFYFHGTFKSEGGSIGGSINCVIKIAGTDQHIKLNRFDVSPSVDGTGDPIFVACPRGSAFLPKMEAGVWCSIRLAVAM